jgi:hypothetical protein
MNEGLNSIKGSMLPNNSLMLAPFKGGKISNEKRVFFAEAICSVIFMGVIEKKWEW